MTLMNKIIHYKNWKFGVTKVKFDVTNIIVFATEFLIYQSIVPSYFECQW